MPPIKHGKYRRARIFSVKRQWAFVYINYWRRKGSMSVYCLSYVNILSTFICLLTALRSSFRLRIYIFIICFSSEGTVLYVLFALYSFNKIFARLPNFNLYFMSLFFSFFLSRKYVLLRGTRWGKMKICFNANRLGYRQLQYDLFATS